MQRRQKYVWARFFVLVVCGTVLLTPVFTAMLVAFLFRMLSRMVSWGCQKISSFFFSGMEWCSIGLGFMEPKQNDDIPQPE